MEVEELQATWIQLSAELEQQKILTEQIILQMTQERYSNKFKTISTYETIGAVICFLSGFYMLVNITKLDTWYLMTCGILTITFLFTMPILVLRALWQIKNIKIIDVSVSETLVKFKKSKNKLLSLQQFTVYASFILMLTTAAVFKKIWSNKDFFMAERGLWSYGAIAVVAIFLFFFAKWAYTCYKNITRSAEDVLKELDN